MAIEKLGKTLFDCIKERQKLFQVKTVCQIGI